MDIALSSRTILILLLTAAAIVVAPLVVPGIEGAFHGTDDIAAQVIESSRPGYQRWATPLWEPPSAEIESLLFALQAATGAGILGYTLGRRHERRKQ